MFPGRGLGPRLRAVLFVKPCPQFGQWWERDAALVVPPPWCAPPILFEMASYHGRRGVLQIRDKVAGGDIETLVVRLTGRDGDVWKGQVGARKLTIASEMLNQQIYTSPTVCLLFSEGLRLRDLPDIKIREISFLQKKQ